MMVRFTYPEEHFLNAAETAERILEILRTRPKGTVTINSVGMILEYEVGISRQKRDPEAHLRRAHHNTVCAALNDLLRRKVIAIEEILQSRLENDFTPFALMCMDGVITLVAESPTSDVT